MRNPSIEDKRTTPKPCLLGQRKMIFSAVLLLPAELTQVLLTLVTHLCCFVHFPHKDTGAKTHAATGKVGQVIVQSCCWCCWTHYVLLSETSFSGKKEDVVAGKGFVIQLGWHSWLRSLVVVAVRLGKHRERNGSDYRSAEWLPHKWVTVCEQKQRLLFIMRSLDLLYTLGL